MATLDRRGFTLIELLVVVAIIGVLATIVISSLVGAQRKGGSTTNVSNMREYELAFENYFQLHGSYPNTNNVGVQYCLGSSTCTYKGTTLSSNATVNAALQPYLASLATANTLMINVGGQKTQGAFYECTNVSCTTATVKFIELGNDTCQIGQPTALGDNAAQLAAPAGPLTDGIYTLCGDTP